MLIYPTAFLASALVVYLINQLELIPWRRLPTGTHWTEQARVLWPMRAGNLAKIFILPLGVIAACKIYHPDASILALLVISLAGSFLGCYPQDRAIYPEMNFRHWLLSSVRHYLCFAFSKGMLVFAALVMPVKIDSIGWTLAGSAVAWHLGLQFGLGTWLMHSLGIMTPAPVDLETRVRGIGTALNVPVRRVWIIDWLVPNAVAFVTTRDIGFTKTLIKICTDAELDAICAHECGHLQESRWMVGLRVLQSLALTPIIFVRPMNSSFGSLGLLFLCYFGLGIFLLQRLYSQKLERRADAVAKDYATTPQAYAQALEKIHQAGLHPAVVGKDGSVSHPNLYDRMVAAGVTPAYPRPAPPSQLSISSMVVVFISVILIMIVLRGK